MWPMLQGYAGTHSKRLPSITTRNFLNATLTGLKKSGRLIGGESLRAKEYLRKVRDLDKECSAILSRIEELHADITRTTAILSDMPRGGKQDRREEILTEMIDLKCRFRTDLLELIRLKGEAIGLINSLKDSRYRLVLNHYYLGGMTWERVAVTMGISYQWAHRLHGQALKEFQKKLKKVYTS